MKEGVMNASIFVIFLAGAIAAVMALPNPAYSLQANGTNLSYAFDIIPPAFINPMANASIAVDCGAYRILEAYGGHDPYAQIGSPVWNMETGSLLVLQQAKQVC